MFFNHRWIRRAVKGPTTRGVWGHAPPENFEILVLWNAISSVLRGQILFKMFSKSIVLFMLIFIGVTSHGSSQFYFIQVVRFLKLLWISLSAKYTSVWCHCMSIIRIHLKISEQLSKSEIFLSRTHIDRDSGQFSSKIGRTRTRPGWLKSLHRNTTFYIWPHLCLTRLNEFRFFLTYFLRTSFKFSSMQSVECALKTR